MARTKQFNVDSVLDAAVQLFWQQGYHATSARDLVNHLSVSRSSLYDTFGDKHSLYLQSLHQYRKRIIGKQLYLIETSEDIRETIEALFGMVISQDSDAFRPKGCMIVNAATELAGVDAEVAAIVKGSQWEVRKSLEMALKKAQNQGQFGASKDPIAISHLVYNALTGLRVSLQVAQDPAVLGLIIKGTLSHLD
ncbi:MAG: TetR family transcriptional regulator [Gilvibacter sp.]